MVIVVASIVTATKSYIVFLDHHAILVVIGGTIAASLMCFPVSSYFRIAGVFLKKYLGNYSTRYETVILEMVDLARGYRTDTAHLKNSIPKIKTLFLKDAIELLVQGGITEAAFDAIMKKRALTHTKRFEDDANIFKTISKFPPAFGLMGTTLGMIALLQELGGADAQSKLGPAMAVGLVATFYGITLANLVFIPIGENLTKINKEDEMIRSMVIDGVRLIRAKEHPVVVEEFLKSYLLPAERAAMKKGKPAAAKA